MRPETFEEREKEMVLAGPARGALMTFSAVCFVIICIILWSAPAYAEFSGNKFLSLNEKEQLYYVAGTVDVFTSTISAGAPAVFPEGVTYMQIKDVVTKYITINPDKRHLHCPLLFYMAFKEAFPGFHHEALREIGRPPK